MGRRPGSMMFDALMILFTIFALTYITRLWPILLLGIIALIAAAIWLLCKSVPKQIEPPAAPVMLLPPPNKHELHDAAFISLQNRISDELLQHYPNARWIWGTRNPKYAMQHDGDLTILLNRAGGYRQAYVTVRNLEFVRMVFETSPAKPSSTDPQCGEDSAVKDNEEEETIPMTPEELPVNYGLIAFVWVEEHLLALNARWNEAVAQNLDYLQVYAPELPTRESWPDICKELLRQGFQNAEITDWGLRLRANGSKPYVETQSGYHVAKDFEELTPNMR